MSSEILLHQVFGAPRGFVAAVMAAALSVLTAIYVAAKLPQIQSFGEIAFPFFFGFATGFVGAALAIATLAISRRQLKQDRRQRDLPL